MKPQDRTRAILTSRLEPAIRLLLVTIADFMDESDLCWPAVETIAERSGYCERQVRDLLEDAERRKLIRRWQGDHRARDIRIEWEALATATPRESKRGGKREPAKTATSPAKTAPHDTGSLCIPDRQSLHTGPAKTASLTGKDCPRSVHEAIREASTEATSAPAAPPDPTPEPVKPPKPKPPDDALTLWTVYRQHRLDLPLLERVVGRAARPTLGLTPTPANRKALGVILTEAGSLERAGTYLAWVHQSGDLWALRLRGEAPWPDGDVTVRLDAVSLGRSLPGRLAEADAWDARGRCDAPEPRQITHRPRDGPERDTAAEDAEIERRHDERERRRREQLGLPIPDHLRTPA